MSLVLCRRLLYALTQGERFISWMVLVLTEVHGLANHLARSQLVPRSKQCISVLGLSWGLQNNSLPSAHATRLILTPFPHSAEHCNSDECRVTVFRKCVHISSLFWRKIKLKIQYLERPFSLYVNYHRKVVLFNYQINARSTFQN